MSHRETIHFKRLKLEFTSEGYPRMGSHLNPNGAAVLPVTADGKFILVKEPRYLETGEWTPVWNLLRGGRDGADEPLLVTAQREMLEESGLSVPEHRLVDLGLFYPDFGLSTTSCQLFAAVLHGLEVPETLQGDQTLEVRAFGADELDTMLLKGELADMFIPAALALWKARTRVEKWQSNGTRSLSLNLPASQLDELSIVALYRWSEKHPSATLTERSGFVRFSGTWVPLDGESGPWGD
jgi:8-oxo-dGTP pyrophosphatase MutT (NUDIX family)